MQTAHELGARFDDALEAVSREVHRAEGGAQWLQKALGLIVGAQQRIPTDTDLALTKAVKDALTKLHGDISALGQTAMNERMALIGKADGLRLAVSTTKKLYDEEAGKQTAVFEAEAAMRAGAEERRVKPTIKAQRSKVPKNAKNA